jgi:hypothetical protein
MPQRNWHVKKVVETDGEVDDRAYQKSRPVHDDEIEQRVAVMTEVARLEQAEREMAREEYQKYKEEYKKEKQPRSQREQRMLQRKSHEHIMR